MPSPDTASRTNQTAHLSLWDTVSIILGIVIGAGIYETAPMVFQNSPNGWAALGIWGLGGLLSLVGALCYAELASTYPRSGGDYEYLTRAYGRCAGFLFGWAQLAVIMTGSIGMMAYIFADYATRLWSWGPGSNVSYAVGAVVVFSVLNLAGVLLGKQTQNLLTLAKILGIGAILAAGLLWGTGTDSTPTTPGPTTSVSLGLALVLVLYTYGGWNDAAYVASEVTDQPRNIPRALIFGTLLLTLIYVAVNAAYWWGLGWEKARTSKAIAADLLQGPLGGTGAKAMSLLVIVSALGAVNGLIYTGSRIYATMGEDFRWFSALAKWHPRFGTPALSIVVQAVITLALVALVGTAAGRAGLNLLLRSTGGAPTDWEGHGGFDTLLRCTAPVFWFFFLLTGVSLFVLRHRDARRPRPFKVPGYPLVPLVFCLTCIYMLYSATSYAGMLTLIGAAPVIAGVLLYGAASFKTWQPVKTAEQVASQKKTEVQTRADT